MLSFILALLAISASCTKARKCECRHVTTDTTTKVFFINGTKNVSGKACKNMADSIETCVLKN
ncbi:MAG: hypothetical protein ACXVP0_06185 [Bacteroidia bacterium]